MSKANSLGATPDEIIESLQGDVMTLTRLRSADRRRIADLEAARDRTYYGQWISESEAHADTKREWIEERARLRKAIAEALWGHTNAAQYDAGVIAALAAFDAAIEAAREGGAR